MILQWSGQRLCHNQNDRVDASKSLFKAEMVVMHYFADRLQAGPFARTYMLGYEQMMRKKSIKSRKYRGHSPPKRQNILIFHQNPLQHPISSLSACHVIIYSANVVLTENNEFEPSNILQNVTDIYSYFVPVICFYVKFTNK